MRRFLVELLNNAIDLFAASRFELRDLTVVETRRKRETCIDLRCEPTFEVNFVPYADLHLTVTGHGGARISIPINSDTEEIRNRAGRALRQEWPGRVWGEPRVRRALGLA